MPRYNVLLPGTAESIFIQDKRQFELGGALFAKSTFGTPWAYKVAQAGFRACK